MLIQLLFVMLAAVNIAAYFLMWKDKIRIWLILMPYWYFFLE